MLLLGGGLVLFASLLYDLGAAAVLASLRLVGIGIVPIVLQEILAYTANTLGWLAAFPRSAPRLPFRRLLAARIAGDAVNYLTPTATLGGEFVRSGMLRGHAPTTSIVASLAVARLSQTIGLFAFVGIGLATVVDHSLLPGHLTRWIVAGLGVFAGLLTLLVLGQRRGMFGPLLRLAEARLGLTPGHGLGHALRRLDEDIVRFHADGSARFLLSSASFCAGFALGTVESYLALWFLGMPVTVERALTIEVLSVAFNNLLFFVPLRAGTQEAGKVLIFGLLGLDPAKGLAVGILYRIRELAWALVGLAIVVRHHTRSRPAGPPGAATSQGPGG